MRSVNLPAPFIALFLAATQISPSAEKKPGDTAAAADNLFIASEFAVEIEYPNFVISFLAHITGAHIERLKLEEWDSNSPAPESFLYHLSEGDSRWLELSSDTAFKSFVTLPRSDRALVSPGAHKFVRQLVKLFKSPSPDTLRGVFEYAGDTLNARAFQQSASLDSGLQVTTVSRVETWNRDTGEEYINGDVRAVTRDGITTYQDIKISLKHKNVKMHFTPLHIGIARGVEQTHPAGASAQNTLRRPD
jgi:hypothetical protein